MLSLKMSSLERQRSEAKCTYINVLQMTLYNDHSWRVSAMQHWSYKQHWSIFLNLEVTREVIENRGGKGKLQKFTWWWLLFLETDHRLTQQYGPQPFFPIGRDSNSPEFFLFQPVPSLFLNSPQMSQNLILSMFRLWLLNVESSRQICLRGVKVIFGLSKGSFSESV